MTDAPKKKALIVVKEDALGSAIAAILEGLAYEWTVVLAGTNTAREEVQRLLLHARFDLIVTRQRMSPYSASDLLHDIETFDGTGLPGVICLADDQSFYKQFILKGGASFHVLEPGIIDLQQEIEKGVQNVAAHRAAKKFSKVNVLRYIESLKNELEFQRFIERIFRELEYSGVRHRHGRLEKGNDMVCWERNKLHQSEYVGVQVKFGNVDGSGGSSGIGELRRQANEAFGISVPFDDGDHDIDKFVIIASGIINEDARDKLSGLIRNDHFHRRVYFFDREAIADLVVTSCPAILASIE